MNQKQTFQHKIPILILAVAALLFAVFSCSTYFVYYSWDYVGGQYVFTLEFGLPNLFELLSFFISIAPYVLLVVYLTIFHKDYKATILVPIIFGLIAFTHLFYFIENLVYGYGIYPLDLILGVPLIAAFVLAAICALKGFSKKIFLIIAVAVGLLVASWSIINFFQNLALYLEEELHLYLFTLPAGILGRIVLYLALFLFGMKNRIPAVLTESPEKEKKNAEKMDPEQALRQLKEKFEFGMITEGEYQAQRADIIRKL